MIISSTFQIVIDIEFTTQINCELVQSGVFINTIFCTLEIYVYFRFVDEGVDYAIPAYIMWYAYNVSINDRNVSKSLEDKAMAIALELSLLHCSQT